MAANSQEHSVRPVVVLTPEPQHATRIFTEPARAESSNDVSRSSTWKARPNGSMTSWLAPSL